MPREASAMAAPAGPKQPAFALGPLQDIGAPRRSDSSGLAASPGRTLVVGRDIVFKGEIASCEKLIIEGRVEGDITKTQRLEIAESGRFTGRAEVEECVVAGACEGELSVAGPLTIRAKGRVKGAVRYVEIEIQRGGRLSGDVDAQAVREVTKSPPPSESTSDAGPESAGRMPPTNQRPTDPELAPGTGPRSG